MMISKLLVENYAFIGGSPREVLEMVNNQISKNNREQMFVTIWLGILDLKTGRLTAANAGHEYPIMKQPEDDFKVITDRYGLFVGIKGGIHYRDYELTLEKGSKLFVYTDGVPEATDANEKMFGMDRLLRALVEVEEETPQNILKHVRESIDAFVGDAPQFDDITMLCLEYHGPEKPVRECELPAERENIPKAIAFVDQELEAMGCPQKIQTLLSVAIDEILSNIVQYAYGTGKESLSMRIEETESPHGVMITFVDTGAAFNPLEVSEPDISLTADERPTGGLGIFLARKMVDEMSYERVDGRNILRITKQF
ncbi:MAG: SpoIIE family protein phosphatase [Clostridia bacterium]|nr:SpoIIE family protein phosphatase [Clostridia bacterium]